MSEPDLRLVLPATAENVAVARHAISGLAEGVEMDPPQVADLKTVVTEAAMNVVVHAYDEGPGPLEVDVVRDGQELVVSVRDRGGGIRPQPEAHRGSLRMGLPLIAALSTSFEIKGGPERGTEVIMRMSLSADGAREVAGIEETGAAGAAVSMPAGELVGTVLSRVISLFAVRANFSVDRLSDAVLLGDAISAQAPAQFLDGTAHVLVDESDGTLSVRVGPLTDGAGDRFLERMRIPEIEATLEGLADDVHVERSGGEEHLLLELGQGSG